MKWSKTVAIVPLLAGSVLFQPAFAKSMNLDDELLHMSGEFALGNGETQSIVNNKAEGHYRICVRQARQPVELNVKHDGQETVINAGNCADFEAKSIEVSPVGKLAKDTILLGKYHHLKL
jgi:hypothetical protein